MYVLFAEHVGISRIYFEELALHKEALFRIQDEENKVFYISQSHRRLVIQMWRDLACEQSLTGGQKI